MHTFCFGLQFVPRSGNFGFGNEIKSHGSISLEYVGWSMVFVMFLVFNSVTIEADCIVTYHRVKYLYFLL